MLVIVEHLYKEGEKSHRFNTLEHFPYASKVESYKRRIKGRLKGAGMLCSRLIVIFEDADYLPGSGLLNVLHSFVGYEEQPFGIDFRKFVFNK